MFTERIDQNLWASTMHRDIRNLQEISKTADCCKGKEGGSVLHRNCNVRDNMDPLVKHLAENPGSFDIVCRQMNSQYTR